MSNSAQTLNPNQKTSKEYSKQSNTDRKDDKTRTGAMKDEGGSCSSDKMGGCN